MALIKCPVCGKDISDRAKSCVHCGEVFAIAANNEKTSDHKENEPKAEIPKGTKKSKKLILIPVFSLLLIGIAVFLILTLVKREKTNKDVVELNEAIDELSNSSIDNEAYIASLMEKYDSLSDKDKKKVKNYDVLKSKNEKIALQKATQAAEEQKKKDDEERKRKKEEEEKANLKKEQDTFLKISDHVTDADNELTTFLNIMNASGATYDDVYKCVINYSDHLSKCKNELASAYNLCGSYNQFSQLKKYLEKAKNSVPLSISSSNSQVINDFLDDLKDLSTALFEVEMEMANISNSY